MAHTASGEKAPSRPGRRPPRRRTRDRLPVDVGQVEALWPAFHAPEPLRDPPRLAAAGRPLPAARIKPPPGGRVLDRPQPRAPAHRPDLLPNRRRRRCFRPFFSRFHPLRQLAMILPPGIGLWVLRRRAVVGLVPSIGFPGSGRAACAGAEMRLIGKRSPAPSVLPSAAVAYGTRSPAPPPLNSARSSKSRSTTT